MNGLPVIEVASRSLVNDATGLAYEGSVPVGSVGRLGSLAPGNRRYQEMNARTRADRSVPSDLAASPNWDQGSSSTRICRWGVFPSPRARPT